jgi:hypothetical protein
MNPTPIATSAFQLLFPTTSRPPFRVDQTTQPCTSPSPPDPRHGDQNGNYIRPAIFAFERAQFAGCMHLNQHPTRSGTLTLSNQRGYALAQVRKTVTFFDTEVERTPADGGPTTTKRVKSDFWSKVLTKLGTVPNHTDRVYKIGQRQYYGVILRPLSPAIDHLQVGRLRDLSEHLEQTNLADGSVVPLTLGPNLRVSEPTFVVPFGTKGRVAIMSPGRSTRHETIAHWLTGVLNLVPKGKSIRLVPVADPDVIARLLQSKGAVGVEFHMDATQALPSGSQLLDAVEELRDAGPSAGTLLIGWSLGRSGGSDADQSLIKAFAQRIQTGRLARRASVNLVVEDDNGQLKREQHDLFEDHIVTKVHYDVDPNVPSETSTVLHAIADAIKEFNGRGV